MLVIGGIALDYISGVKDASAACTQVLDYSESIGGMGYNTAMAAAQLGVATRLISAVGEDFDQSRVGTPKNGKLKLDFHKAPGYTTRSFMFSDGKDERIYFYRGAYHEIDVKKATNAIDEAAWVHFAGVMPCFAELAEYAKVKKKTVSTNPGYDLFHYKPDDPVVSGLLDNTDYLILSANEAKHLGGGKAAKCKAMITTMGKDGSVVESGGKKAKIPIYFVKAESPFGAGDTYTGGFITAMLTGKGVFESARFASAAASFADEGKTTAPKLDMKKVEERAKAIGL